METLYPSPTRAAASTAPRPVVRKHLQYAENMRGIAILSVIAIHCAGLAWGTAHVPNDSLGSLVGGGTAVFVFLSGFFLHHVHRADFEWASFLAKKAKLLLPPYFAMTLALLLIGPLLGVVVPGKGPAEQFAIAAVTGLAGPAMWFIPFVFLLFALTPLFLRFARADERHQLVVLGVLLALGLYFDRDGDMLSDLGHFSAYYALGIFCSAHRARFEAFAAHPAIIALAAAAVALLIDAQLAYGAPAAPMNGVLNARDLFYLQKFALIFLLAGLAKRLFDRHVSGLTLLGQWSLGLFFTHQLALFLLVPAAWVGMFTAGPDYLRWETASAAVTLLSLAMIWAAKRVLGARSRLLVGV